MQPARNTRIQFTRRAFVTVLLILVAAPVPGGQISIPFNAGDFSAPRDNLYFPKALGHTFVYLAEEEEGVVTNNITQTAATTNILGVPTTVVEDVEWIIVEGVGMFQTEKTQDYIAWDNSGNVWYFGEDTTEYLYDDDWNLVGTSNEGSWQAGVDEAQPGILMLAAPAPGDSYRQEYYPDVAEDMAKVQRVNTTVSIELGDFENCAVTKEWTPLSPGAVESKFYAPEVGLVYIEEHHGRTVSTQLVEVR